MQDTFYIRVVDPGGKIAEKLKCLSDNDMRTMGFETAWLIEQEYARRYSQPQPAITVEDAQAAHAKAEG